MELQLIGSGIVDGGLIPMNRTGQPHRHVSAVIRKLCLKLGHFDENDPDYTRFELGSAFEDAIAHSLAARFAKAYPDRYVVPGELELDGLLGSPDLLDMVLNAMVEIKLTWLSSNQDPEGMKFWKFWVQLMAYCRMWGTDIGHLHVAHVNGDYRLNRNPVYNVWEAKFTQVELSNNWRMLVSNADAA